MPALRRQRQEDGESEDHQGFGVEPYLKQTIKEI